MSFTKRAIGLCVLLVMGTREVIADTVVNICRYNNIACDAVHAICNCVNIDLSTKSGCVNPVSSTCRCDNNNGYFAVTYDTPQIVKGTSTPFTTICEKGKHFKKDFCLDIGEIIFQLKFLI